ncbi:flagellar basal body P-ring protein FlgI [Massilia antarctica]|uniref:Flagellar P-ring protein n=2 Tax=Massilia antarctica TaxID=2765360 RepID=A0AA48W9V0_9BURK|nr:flagellar basal body P-ring protein FlgI [Massilia sp. H27-R4]MCY0915671.1 flagellar basal body P-ring protein FlgI [Massilia sp. H27-R4]QPI48548.1 flagellar basal body P-ring protein FlgI [Massilia antarctica]
MRMKKTIFLALLSLACFASASCHAQAIRIKDMGKIAGWRENALTGYGLVTGLAGTGDSGRSKSARQSLANMLSRFDIAVSADDIQSRNVATVMITASLPPFAREGDQLDISVSSVGDARSLVGGTLMSAPLKGPDGRVYALGQGAVTVGGYRYDMNGNVVQLNHPTVGAVPNGATIEVGVTNKLLSDRNTITFVLAEPDFTTASRIAAAINAQVGSEVADASDPAGVEIRVPEGRRKHLTDFLTTVENVRVEPDRRAKVVINERTGTVVSGGDVRISRVAISQGDLKVSIVTDNAVSQPDLLVQPGEAIRTATVANSRVNVEQKRETGYVAPNNATVADLVQALTRIKTNTRDIISILRAVKAAGALHAELIVQ